MHQERTRGLLRIKQQQQQALIVMLIESAENNVKGKRRHKEALGLVQRTFGIWNPSVLMCEDVGIRDGMQSLKTEQLLKCP